MDEIQHSTSNRKFTENEDNDQIKGESYNNNEENEDGHDTSTDCQTEMTDKFLHEIASVIRIHPTHTHSLRHDINIEQKEDDDREIDTSNKFLNVDMPVVTTLSTRTSSKTDLNSELNTNDDNLKFESNIFETERNGPMFDDPNQRKIKENIEFKSLNEYLNKHQRFLRSIDRDRQLSFYQRKQLDRQKEDLKKLQKKLAEQIEENDRKRLYQKLKEDEILRKRRAFIQRRMEETKLKETRKPRIQTTFRLPIKEKRSKSEMNQKKSKINRMEPSAFSSITQTKSIGSYISNTDSATLSTYQNHVEFQIDANYFNKMDIERQLDKIDKHFKENPDDIGKNLKALIIQFVEHSKRSWIN